MPHYSFAKNQHHFFNAKRNNISYIPPFQTIRYLSLCCCFLGFLHFRFPAAGDTQSPTALCQTARNCTDSSLTDSSLPSVSLAALTLPSGWKARSIRGKVGQLPRTRVWHVGGQGKRWKTLKVLSQAFNLKVVHRVAVSQMLQQNVSLASRDWQLKLC